MAKTTMDNGCAVYGAYNNNVVRIHHDLKNHKTSRKVLETFFQNCSYFINPWILCVSLHIRTTFRKIYWVAIMSVCIRVIRFPFLAFNTRTSRIFGWMAYGISHCCAAYVMHHSDLDIMAYFQVLSVDVSLMGITDELKDRSSSHK